MAGCRAVAEIISATDLLLPAFQTLHQPERPTARPVSSVSKYRATCDDLAGEVWQQMAPATSATTQPVFLDQPASPTGQTARRPYRVAMTIAQPLRYYTSTVDRAPFQSIYDLHIAPP
jgi:hypothetical protein